MLSKLKISKELIVLILVLIITLLLATDDLLRFKIQKKTLSSLLFPTYKISSYPLLKLTPPDISAESAIILDKDSQKVVYAKNPDFRFSPASTTKIMTALVALNNFHLTDILTVKNKIIDGAILGTFVGENFSFENMLYGMLLPSANDMAITIAQNYPDGQDNFIVQMNKKAEELHLVNTHFADPAGLNDNEGYSTARDLARLASYGLENPEFAKIVATKDKNISSTDDINLYSVENLNNLLGKYGVVGMKTGFTDEAKGVLVTAAKQNGHTFILVVMRSDDRFLDTEKLLNYLWSNITFLSMNN